MDVECDLDEREGLDPKGNVPLLASFQERQSFLEVKLGEAEERRPEEDWDLSTPLMSSFTIVSWRSEALKDSLKDDTLPWLLVKLDDMVGVVALVSTDDRSLASVSLSSIACS